MAGKEAEVEWRDKDGGKLEPERMQAVRGVLVFYDVADRLLGAPGQAEKILKVVIGKAEQGDLASAKLIVEFAKRARRAEAISDEEIVGLGTMLMREFHIWREEESGSEEETNGQ